MQTITVQIERLEPMQVATTAVTSQTPEGEALDALLAWARPQGLLKQPYRLFGYDNCQPHPNHTYTTWLSLDRPVETTDTVSIRDFDGGLYAVTEVDDPELIPQRWEQLAAWASAQGYATGGQQCLEEHVGRAGEWIIRLHFSINPE